MSELPKRFRFYPVIRKVKPIPVSAYDLILKTLEDSKEKRVDVVSRKINQHSREIITEKNLYISRSILFTSSNVKLRPQPLNKFTKIYHRKAYSAVKISNTNLLSNIEKRMKLFPRENDVFRSGLSFAALVGSNTFMYWVIKRAYLADPRNGKEIAETILRNFVQEYSHFIGDTLILDFNQKKEHDTRKLVNLIEFAKPVNVLLGVRYLHDRKRTAAVYEKIYDGCYPITKKVIQEGSMEEMFNSYMLPFLKRHSLYLAIDLRMFSKIRQPSILPSFKGRLPCLPPLKNPSKTTQLLKIALLHPKFSKLTTKKEFTDLSSTLNFLGDSIINQLSVSYLINMNEDIPNYKEYHSHYSFMKSNSLLGRLALVYELDTMLSNSDHRKKCQEYRNLPVRKTILSKQYKFYGDLFERLIAVYYLDDEESCKKWIFQIFDNLFENLRVERKDGMVLDISRYIDEVLQNH
ncbi:uncharacterized protein RJT21DRAFT_121426 [Scheffersomyces amazonensis]|uniref:uncharacterized protein n=1 Tax=Scheffersomyces amazonensis TaxID=1078765 RepID=UPI00315DAC9D